MWLLTVYFLSTMDILAQRVLKRFADKHIGKQIIGTVIIQYLQKHYDQTLE